MSNEFGKTPLNNPQEITKYFDETLASEKLILRQIDEDPKDPAAWMFRMLAGLSDEGAHYNDEQRGGSLIGADQETLPIL